MTVSDTERPLLSVALEHAAQWTSSAPGPGDEQQYEALFHVMSRGLTPVSTPFHWFYTRAELDACDSRLGELFDQLFKEVPRIELNTVRTSMAYWNETPLVFPTNLAENDHLAHLGDELSVARVFRCNEDGDGDLRLACDYYVLDKTGNGLVYSRQRCYAKWVVGPALMETYFPGWHQRARQAEAIGLEPQQAIDYTFKRASNARSTLDLVTPTAVVTLPDMSV